VPKTAYGYCWDSNELHSHNEHMRMTISCRYALYCLGRCFWCLFFTGRIAAKRQSSGIKFTHSPKISIFAPQGGLVAPIHVKFGVARGHLIRLAVQNFAPICARGWEHDPKKLKISTFVGSSLGANRFYRFLQLLRDFICPNYSALIFYIWGESLHSLRSYCLETARQSFTPNFSVGNKKLSWWWQTCVTRL